MRARGEREGGGEASENREDRRAAGAHRCQLAAESSGMLAKTSLPGHPFSFLTRRRFAQSETCPCLSLTLLATARRGKGEISPIHPPIPRVVARPECFQR